MKKIIMLLMITILTGCSANYDIDYSNNRYNENLTTSGNITDTNYKNEIDNYYLKSYLLTSYKVQPGDMSKKEVLKNYTIYNKILVNESNNYGLKLGYSYDNKDNYIESSIVYKLFSFFTIEDNYIKLGDIKNIFDSYPMLDNIKITFSTDKYVTESNCDEVKDNKYIWYIDKNNYQNKNIEISLSNTKIGTYKKNIEKYSDKVITFIIIVVSIICLLFILVIYEKIKKSNK